MIMGTWSLKISKEKSEQMDRNARIQRGDKRQSDFFPVALGIYQKFLIHVGALKNHQDLVMLHSVIMTQIFTSAGVHTLVLRGAF